VLPMLGLIAALVSPVITAAALWGSVDASLLLLQIGCFIIPGRNAGFANRAREPPIHTVTAYMCKRPEDCSRTNASAIGRFCRASLSSLSDSDASISSVQTLSCVS